MLRRNYCGAQAACGPDGIVADYSDRKIRFSAARYSFCGSSLVPVIWADVDDAEAARIMPADNRTTRLGFDDPAAG